jgi:hypothetical protein
MAKLKATVRAVLSKANIEALKSGKSLKGVRKALLSKSK